MLKKIIHLSFIFFIICSTFLQAKEIFQNYPLLQDRNFSYRSPTERYIEAYGWESISTSLKNANISMVHRNLFDRIYQREEKGFIGYHGSTQSYRIYQDLIRLILEEIVGLEIREDFHFFRIPGESIYHYQNLEEWKPRDYQPTYFLCMNYAIYGNHLNLGSSSYYYFTTNDSCNIINYQAKIEPLFKRLGIDISFIPTLFKLGYYLIGNENGILYQLFDMSHYDPRKPYYELADAQCILLRYNQKFSDFVRGTEKNWFPGQVRLLMNNKHTLNPHSPLVVKRFDKLTVEETERYWQALRMAVSILEFSKEQAESYKSELLKLWGVENE